MKTVQALQTELKSKTEVVQALCPSANVTEWNAAVVQITTILEHFWQQYASWFNMEEENAFIM